MFMVVFGVELGVLFVARLTNKNQENLNWRNIVCKSSK